MPPGPLSKPELQLASGGIGSASGLPHRRDVTPLGCADPFKLDWSLTVTLLCPPQPHRLL